MSWLPKTGDQLLEIITLDIQYIKEKFNVLVIAWCTDNGSLVASVPLKGSGSQTFKREPSLDVAHFFANAAIALAKLC